MDHQLTTHRKDVTKIERELTHQQDELDLVILRTPTGQVRDDLTEANIHLLAAIQAIREVL